MFLVYCFQLRLALAHGRKALVVSLEAAVLRAFIMYSECVKKNKVNEM
jgi:hypothetical protein